MVKTKLAKFHLHIYKLLHLVSVSIESKGKSSELENVNLEVDYISFLCILQKVLFFICFAIEKETTV